MLHPSFIRVAACTPELRVADPQYNSERIQHLLELLADDAVHIAVFPELSLTGYTCQDLFHQLTLIEAAAEGLEQILTCSRQEYDGIGVVGLPVHVNGRIYNTAVVFQSGRILGVIPKSYLPNYKEFYEARFFAPAMANTRHTISLCGQTAPFGTDLLFASKQNPNAVFGVEICEDLWMPIPPSSLQALSGATIIANLSASNELIGKATYRRQLVANQSARCLAGYVYAAAGVGESTTDLIFGGHNIIAENGTIIAESKRFHQESQYIITDIDVERVARERMMANTFSDNARVYQSHREYLRVEVSTPVRESVQVHLKREADPHPFVPSDSPTLHERCDEIFHAQVAGLAKRLIHANCTAPSIGVSGGLDSTLALLVLCKTFDTVAFHRNQIRALTMPGFGTTDRTLQNARDLMNALGVRYREIDIRTQCLAQLQSLNHRPFGIDVNGLNLSQFNEKLQQVPNDKLHDLVFENVQARMRTSLLMNTGFVIGTGDLSELALGWCTYNADHMSMYNPNVGVPKTLVKFLVRWVAMNEFDGEVRRILLDIVSTEISPELLPATAAGVAPQSTEGAIGPYELHDFFLYHHLRFGCSPEKILYLASHVKFDREYTMDERKKWLRVFYTRFFMNQFKRSCLPDGPKIGSVALSPRGDWRMPSDALAKAWLDQLDQCE